MIQFFKGRQVLLQSLMVVACVCALFTVAMFVPFSVKAEKQVFQFKPSANTTYIQTLVTTRVNDLGEYGKRTEVTELKAKVVINKTETGYSIVTTPLSISMTQDGAEVENPLIPLMLELVVTYDLDEDGQLVDIQGYENLPDMMKEFFPQDVIDILEPIMNPDALFNKEAADWMGRFGLYVGQEFQSGDVWAFRDLYNLAPGRDVTYYTAVQFGAEKMINDRKCVQIKSHYNTDPQQLNTYLEGFYKNVADAFGAEALEVKIADVNISGQGERWMDPSTMLVYDEVDARTIIVKMSVEGVGEVTTSLEETREYSYEYLP